MKKFSRIIICLLAALTLFSALISCGGEKTYKNDVAVSALAESGVKKISLASNLTEASGEFMSFYLNVDASLYSECKVMTPGGSSSIDEFGIFKAKDADSAQKIAEALNKYLEGRVATWDNRYSQSEKPKVDGAKTDIYGNYVCYTILSSSEQSAFLNAIEDMITE